MNTMKHQMLKIFLKMINKQITILKKFDYFDIGIEYQPNIKFINNFYLPFNKQQYCDFVKDILKIDINYINIIYILNI